MIGPKRAPLGKGGVVPRCPNQAEARLGVAPAAIRLSAMPETIWSAPAVIAASPCSSASSNAAAIPAPSPSAAEPVSAATAAPAKAAASILPSSPISTTPERSA